MSERSVVDRQPEPVLSVDGVAGLLRRHRFDRLFRQNALAVRPDAASGQHLVKFNDVRRRREKAPAPLGVTRRTVVEGRHLVEANRLQAPGVGVPTVRRRQAFELFGARVKGCVGHLERRENPLFDERFERLPDDRLDRRLRDVDSEVRIGVARSRLRDQRRHRDRFHQPPNRKRVDSVSFLIRGDKAQARRMTQRLTERRRRFRRAKERRSVLARLRDDEAAKLRQIRCDRRVEVEFSLVDANHRRRRDDRFRLRRDPKVSVGAHRAFRLDVCPTDRFDR